MTGRQGDGRQAARAAAGPLIAMTATWAVRKGMIAVYERRTGKPAPLLHSRNGSIPAKVVWAASMAALIALIEAVVVRVLDDEE